MEEYIKEQNQEYKDYELAHIIGLNPKLPKCIQTHNSMPDTISYAVGGILIVEDLNDKNNQVYFRHGTNQIASFALSNTGKYIAVGFYSISIDKKFPASIILWDAVNKIVISEFTGIYKAVTHLEFSPDDKFLLSCGLDNTISLWEVETGFRCFNRAYEIPINFAFWTNIIVDKNSAYPSYSVTFANIQSIFLLRIVYDYKTMKFSYNIEKFNIPLGFTRTYTSGVYDKDYGMIYLGCSNGELAIIDMKNLLFKYSFNVSFAGVASLALLPDSSLIIGGGDGKVKKLVIENNKHVMTHEIQLNGKIASLCLNSDNKEVICSTSLGYTYRILTADLTHTLHNFSHVSNVNDCIHIDNDKCLTVDGNVNYINIG
jgi:WD40 repeat protein